MTQRQRAARRTGESAPLRRARAARRRRQRRRTMLAVLASALVVLIALGAWALIHRGGAPLFDRYPMRYEAEIRQAAAEFSLDPAYVASVALAESSFDAEAVSSVGAIGLMQIMPSTGEWIAGKLDEAFDAQRLYEPSVNLRYGCWYLRFLLDRYDGDMRTASTAYHQGQGRVDEWLQDPEYSEDGKTLSVISSSVTDTYVNRIMENYAHYQELY
ncbi:MAG TPA: lytic transglycosylase domain-containing protein [Candidatus Pullichristensenella stercoripullorum]|nr:lytic transglycosylase domain-containing protein [Candidatus Pullichristensenella stercoripullorum]